MSLRRLPKKGFHSGGKAIPKGELLTGEKKGPIGGKKTA